MTISNDPSPNTAEDAKHHEIDEVLTDIQDLVVVIARTATDDSHRTSFDDVLEAFGHTRESLAAIPGN